MKLLFLSMWYHPEPVSKPHSLAKEMLKKGHEVTVITSFPNYPEGSIFDEYKGKGFLMIERIEGIRVIRVWSIRDRSQNALRRILAMLSFSINATIVSLLLFTKFNAMWTYQIGYPGFFLTIFTGIPYFHEVQDLWPAWSEGGMNGLNKILTKCLLFCQKKICLLAKKIITISKGFRDTITNYYSIRKTKIYIIPNWADNAFCGLQNQLVTRSSFGLPNGYIITYGGNVGIAQRLDYFVLAGKLLMGKEGLFLVIAGDGIEKVKIENLVISEKIDNVICLPKLKPSTMADLFSISDALFISLSNEKKYSITIPSKTYAYLAAEKPILAAVEGDLKDFINENNIGITCEPGNIEQISKMISDFIKLGKKRTMEMSNNAHRLITGKLSRSNTIREYCKIFNDLPLSIP